MKKINFFSLAATYAGCFLGAGYVSGRELMQFFGRFGLHGFYGLGLTVVIQLVIACTLLLLVRRTGIYQTDRVIVPWELPWLQTAMGAFIALFLFLVALTMFAAFGAMLTQLFGLPSFAGAAILAAIVAVLAILGLKSVVAAFSVFVPVLAAAAIWLCIAALVVFGVPRIPASGGDGNWALSAASFVSYNILASVGVLIPVGQYVKSRKSIFAGIALGSLSLTVVAAGLILSMYALPGSENAELPMLAVADALHPACGLGYALLLFGGMLGAALSSIVAAEIYLRQKLPKLDKHRTAIILVMVALALALSNLGFSQLVNSVYPICGYVGFAALLGILIHYGMTFRKKHHVKGERR